MIADVIIAHSAGIPPDADHYSLPRVRAEKVCAAQPVGIPEDRSAGYSFGAEEFSGYRGALLLAEPCFSGRAVEVKLKQLAARCRERNENFFSAPAVSSAAVLNTS